MVNTETISYASARDPNPCAGSVAYYGYKMVNLRHLMYRTNLPTDEPFILATQAREVWYIIDPADENWSIVVPMVRRDTYDVYTTMDDNFRTRFNVDDGCTSRGPADYWLREDVEGVIVEGEANMNVGTSLSGMIEEDSSEESDCVSL
ncbi:uncharacterized protein LOC127258329 [Andrographis paniculata]|uniref:uncharacterized protein LOC127258329 n=1 Tax=Andrographis paniculata TaxID=175694 RepID=UPI0021E78C0F|nr:uncharacterized protein LOC127258329 [Andrographis paniculata]